MKVKRQDKTGRGSAIFPCHTNHVIKFAPPYIGFYGRTPKCQKKSVASAAIMMNGSG